RQQSSSTHEMRRGMHSSVKKSSPRAPPLAPVLLLICGLSLLQRPASAEIKSYVVYLGFHSHGREGAALASNQERAKNSHYQFLGSVLGRARRRRRTPSSTPTPGTSMASPPRWRKKTQCRSQSTRA
uniref:Uncharacterized protein n=1 Tax=Aegilops tauschii subsp. strangulata TaxID=200361 RepID=A0A453L2E1_AEGTS